LNNYAEIEHFFLFNTRKSSLEKEVPLQKASIVYPKGWFWKSFPSLWRLMGQWKQIKAEKVDLYHGLSGEMPLQFRKNTITKLVSIHDLIFLSHPQYYNPFDKIIYKFKFKYAARTADHIVAISEQTKADIVKYLKIDAAKISVVYQGCNKAYKQKYTAQEIAAVKRRHGLPDQYILNVGTLQERKNALTLIKAIKGTSYHVVLVGQEKGYAKKLHRYIQNHKLYNQVSFVQNVDVGQLAKIYQGATVFCYPSICEGFGIPIIEALYSNIPVIATQDGCFPEAAGPHSIFVDPLNSKMIRKELTRIYENPNLGRQIADKGFEYVQRFSDENVANSLMNLYKAVI
ncbi:MAG: glycosyltransferase family 4 protein, partial [Croceitalea sp.]|nr:glycosyltransferase family 4 protein [Croceitalea sp.]